jgi:hypothetical protein
MFWPGFIIAFHLEGAPVRFGRESKRREFPNSGDQFSVEGLRAGAEIFVCQRNNAASGEQLQLLLKFDIREMHLPGDLLDGRQVFEPGVLRRAHADPLIDVARHDLALSEQGADVVGFIPKNMDYDYVGRVAEDMQIVLYY